MEAVAVALTPFGAKVGVDIVRRFFPALGGTWLNVVAVVVAAALYAVGQEVTGDGAAFLETIGGGVLLGSAAGAVHDFQPERTLHSLPISTAHSWQSPPTSSSQWHFTQADSDSDTT